MLPLHTFKLPLEKSTRSSMVTWSTFSPMAIDKKLAASLRVVLPPTKRNVYLEAMCSTAPGVTRA